MPSDAKWTALKRRLWRIKRRSCRGSGTIGGPLRGPGIVMPRRCACGGWPDGLGDLAMDCGERRPESSSRDGVPAADGLAVWEISPWTAEKDNRNRQAATVSLRRMKRRSCRGSGTIGGPLRGPGIVMPRRCACGGWPDGLGDLAMDCGKRSQEADRFLLIRNRQKETLSRRDKKTTEHLKRSPSAPLFLPKMERGLP